ncbi:MAG: ribonucleotide-diphosphate reductase subunit alpha [Hyphomicrobiales bacterium]|nr:ribonucleotide-diphosphate reductase subunit alpha [Hyphomicrobiales bacterium]
MANLTRRDAILAGVSAAIAAVGHAGFPTSLYAQTDVTVDQFLVLSERLTETRDLDRTVAKTLLGGFLATGHGAELQRLAGESFTSFSPLANAIVAAWYSGLYDTGNSQAVADFTGALVWSALTFTKPFAECGGETGYWSDPPEA